MDGVRPEEQLPFHSRHKDHMVYPLFNAWCDTSAAGGCESAERYIWQAIYSAMAGAVAEIAMQRSQGLVH